MTIAEINAMYDEMLAPITGTSGQHIATIKMIEGWREEALNKAAA